MVSIRSSSMSNTPQSLVPLHSMSDKITLISVCNEITPSLHLHLSASFYLPHGLLQRYCVCPLEMSSQWTLCTHPTLEDYICKRSLTDTACVFYLGVVIVSNHECPSLRLPFLCDGTKNIIFGKAVGCTLISEPLLHSNLTYLDP